jgi:hypothetical protein
LEAEMVADLQIYEPDPLSVPTSTWDKLRPRAVLLGGVRVYGGF